MRVARDWLSGTTRTMGVSSILAALSSRAMTSSMALRSASLATRLTALVKSSAWMTGRAAPRRSSYIAVSLSATSQASACSRTTYLTSRSGPALSSVSSNCSTMVKCTGVVETTRLLVRSSAVTLNGAASAERPRPCWRSMSRNSPPIDPASSSAEEFSSLNTRTCTPEAVPD